MHACMHAFICMYIYIYIYNNAWRQTVSLWGSTPATPSKTATAPSLNVRFDVCLHPYKCIYIYICI